MKSRLVVTNSLVQHQGLECLRENSWVVFVSEVKGQFPSPLTGLMVIYFGAFPGLRPRLRARAPSWATVHGSLRELLPLRGFGFPRAKAVEGRRGTRYDFPVLPPCIAMGSALRKVLILLLVAAAQAVAAQQVSQWRSGLTEINEGWATHAGDDLRWAQPNVDDSAWQHVDIEDMGPAKPGWRWFRKRVNVGPDHSNLRLLISGGDGTYELFVNGARVEGPKIKSAFKVSRPTEMVFDLSE